MRWLALLLLILTVPAKAQSLPGPVPADVEEVVDGDTLKVRARVWIGQEILVAVRLRGIDAPEMRARCDTEREMAEAARDGLSRLIGGEAVILTSVDGGKYFGRVVADIATAQGQDAASELLRKGLVRPYAGGRREGWCAGAATASR